jgi:hypothetical protein
VNELLDSPRHNFEMDLYTDKMDGMWTDHLQVWMTKVQFPSPSLLFGLTQLKINFEPTIIRFSESQRACRNIFRDSGSIPASTNG